MADWLARSRADHVLCSKGRRLEQSLVLEHPHHRHRHRVRTDHGFQGSVGSLYRLVANRACMGGIRVDRCMYCIGCVACGCSRCYPVGRTPSSLVTLRVSSADSFTRADNYAAGSGFFFESHAPRDSVDCLRVIAKRKRLPIKSILERFAEPLVRHHFIGPSLSVESGKSAALLQSHLRPAQNSADVSQIANLDQRSYLVS